MEHLYDATEQKNQAIKALREQIERLDAEQLELRAKISEHHGKEDDESAAERKLHTDALRHTLTQERQLHDRKNALEAEVREVNEAISVAEKELDKSDLYRDALESLRDVFGAPTFPEELPVAERAKHLITHLHTTSNTELPLYVKNGNLLEREKLGFDDVIVEHFEALVYHDPVAALEHLSHSVHTSDVKEANTMLEKAYVAWDSFWKKEQERITKHR